MNDDPIMAAFMAGAPPSLIDELHGKPRGWARAHISEVWRREKEGRARLGTEKGSRGDRIG